MQQVQPAGETRDHASAAGNRIRIAIDRPECAPRRRKNSLRITAAAEGAIEVDAAVTRRQRLHTSASITGLCRTVISPLPLGEVGARQRAG